jgi:hypothetical protein
MLGQDAARNGKVHPAIGASQLCLAARLEWTLSAIIVPPGARRSSGKVPTEWNVPEGLFLNHA